MKKLTFLIALFATIFIASSFVTSKEDAQKEVMVASVKIINDTSNDIRIYTGSGHVKLNKRGGSTSVSCSSGKKIYTSDGSSKGDLIFEMESSMCGDVVYLSDYL